MRSATRSGGRAPAGGRQPSGPLSFRAALAQMDKAQKPGAGVPAYTRWINRRLARYAAAAAVALRIPPNLVTAASAALSLCGLLVLLLGAQEGLTGPAAALLLAAGYVLDSADGQVARVTGRGGPAGEWLDHVVDAVRTPAVHLAVLGGLVLHTDASRLVLVLPLLYCLLSAGHFMSQILAEQLVRRHRPDPGRDPAPPPLRSFLLLPADAGVLCWVFVCWGSEGAFLVAYGCLFLFNLLAGAASMRRKYRTLVSL